MAASEEQMRLLVDGSRVHAIVLLDPDGIIQTWNRGAERLKGYQAHEAIGQHFSLLYTPEDVASGHPQEELRGAQADGSYEEEGWRVRRDGTRFWANGFLRSQHVDYAQGYHVGRPVPVPQAFPELPPLPALRSSLD